jgi:nucleotide-binding universal stress UspA family protein
MPVFRTLLHPADFDEPSKEAYRVARSLAQAVDARVVAFRVVSPPAIVTQAGRISLDPNGPEPADDCGGCRVALARFRRTVGTTA